MTFEAVAGSGSRDDSGSGAPAAAERFAQPLVRSGWACAASSICCVPLCKLFHVTSHSDVVPFPQPALLPPTDSSAGADAIELLSIALDALKLWTAGIASEQRRQGSWSQQQLRFGILKYNGEYLDARCGSSPLFANILEHIHGDLAGSTHFFGTYG